MTDNPSLLNNPNLDDWLIILPDGDIEARSGKVDVGQRISTALAIIVSEEMDVDLEHIQIAPPATIGFPDEGMTTGSNSIEQSGHALRRAAATARRHLIGIAVEKFGAPAECLNIKDGLIGVTGTNQTINFAELMDGGGFGIPVDPNAPLKPTEDHRWIGNAATPRHMTEFVTGAFSYVHDMALPGMLHARPIRPPHANAQLIDFDPKVTAQLTGDGIIIVRNGSFAALAGEDEYALIKAARRLAETAEWDLGDGLDTEDVFQRLRDNDHLSLPVVDGTPVDDPAPALRDPPPDAAQTLSARYERPYVMHATIGPSAGMAVCTDTGIEVWTHSQGIHSFRASAAEALGVAPDTLTVHHALGAGCYGHNGADDAAFDAVLIARAIPGRPVLLKWTRDDEHAWEPYGSCMAAETRASINAAGQIIQWSQDTYSDTHRGRPRPDPGGDGPARLLGARYLSDPARAFSAKPTMTRQGGLHRNLDPYYDFPDTRLVKHLVRDLPLRTSALRCLGAHVNVFALESFIDELARAAKIDALAFRLNHLSDRRAKTVLNACAEAIGWGDVAAEGHGLGLAFARYTNSKTYAAVGVDLSVDDAAQVHLNRVVIAADAGEVIDRAGLSAQLEGGFLQAASWTLYEQVTFDESGITSRDWDTYPILRFDNVPDIETILMERPGDAPLGAGEAVGGPAAGAIANAIFNATQIRMRRMPFTPDMIRAAAAAGAN